MQQRIGEVNDGIVSDFSESVKNLSEAFGKMDIDTNYTAKIVDTMQESFKTLMTFIPSGKDKNPLGGVVVGAGLGTGLASALTAQNIFLTKPLNNHILAKIILKCAIVS